MEASSSAHWVECGAECGAGICQQGICSYTQSYTEGSSISGVWFRDVVRLGDASQHNPPVNATLGCHIDERKLFYTQRVNGIMGMAPHEFSDRPTILNDLFADKEHINTGMFALCFAEWGGELTVGGYESAYHLNGTDIEWMPLSHSGYYSVTPQKLMVGDVVVASDAAMFGQSLVDSGTTFTYFPEPVFARLMAALVAACTTAPGCAALQDRSQGDCWRLDAGATDPKHFPPFTLEFPGGSQVRWSARSYLFQRGDPNLWCHAFASNGAEADTVLGVSFMIHKDIIFDLVASKLGVAEAICPEHVRVPGESGGPFSIFEYSRPTLMLLLNCVWILALLVVAATLVWCVYLWFCDKDRSYERPDQEADEEE